MVAEVGPVVVGTAGSAAQVSRCTSVRARAGQMAVENPERGHGAQRARAARVALRVRRVVCTRVDVNESEGVEGEQVGEEQTDTLMKDHAHHEKTGRQMRDPC